MKREFIFEKIGNVVYLTSESNQIWGVWHEDNPFTARKGKNVEKNILRNIPYATFTYKF